MTRKIDEIDAIEKQIAESLVDQVRDDLLRAAGKEPEPESNADGEFNLTTLRGSRRRCARRRPSLSAMRKVGRR
jgi:hypothetical protein